MFDIFEECFRDCPNCHYAMYDDNNNIYDDERDYDCSQCVSAKKCQIEVLSDGRNIEKKTIDEIIGGCK